MRDTVVHVSDSFQFGGTEQVILQLLEGLPRSRWKCVLFHPPANGPSQLLEQAGALGVEHHESDSLLSWARLRGMVPLVQQLRSIRPSVVHVHLTQPLACKFTVIAAALARVPAVVATIHLYNHLPAGWPIRQHHAMAAMVDRYIAVSHEVARKLHRGLAVPERKIRVVRNGVPVERFQPSTRTRLRDLFTGGVDVPIVLTVARLDHQKGYPFLLTAAMQVPDALFLVAGDGPQRAALEARARSMGLGERVRFLGHRVDVPELLRNCDLFVLPSLYEGFPLAVLEAMAAGKPVVATSIGGINEAVVHGETGFMVPVADAVALASAIRTLINDPALGCRLGANGRQRVNAQFRAERMVCGVASVYDEALP